MQEPCEVYTNVASVATRLNQLGIPQEALQEAIRTAISQASGCTENDVPMARGMIAWMKGVRGLRDQLGPKGWRRDDTQNFSTVVDPTNSYAIAVAAGNPYTGRHDKTPSTQTDRGPVTRSAVEKNRQLHLSLVDPKFGPAPVSTVGAETWLLLYFEDSAADEIRIELSLPNKMTAEGFVTSWQERIIISPLSESSQVTVQTPGDGDDQDDLQIEVTKREAS